MFKFLFALVVFCLAEQISYAQTAKADVLAASIPDNSCNSVDALASYIKQNFSGDTTRIRAIYIWIADHISYDVQRLAAMEKNPDNPPQTISEVLKTRSAVCQGYSELFVALCKGVGINANLVSGYTKNQGKVNPISHAWVAAEFDGQWYLFDPTWGAGYINDNKFVKRFNNSFYKVQPDIFIADHMPFDPMYQFLTYPLTNKEFIEGKTAAAKAPFQFTDTLKQHIQLSPDQQLAAELRRLEAAGIQNDLLLRRQQYLRKSLQSYSSKDAFEEGGKAFMAAMDLYKTYIGHKNKQFSAIADSELQQMMDSIEYNVKLSRSLLLQAVTKTDAQRQAKAGNISNLDHFWVQLTKEKQFVQQYIGADASARKQLFMRK
jgi:hypothetical protein